MGRVRQHFRWVVLCLAGGEGKKRDTGAANLLFVVFLMTEGPRRPKLQPGPEEGCWGRSAGWGDGDMGQTSTKPDATLRGQEGNSTSVTSEELIIFMPH